MSESTLVVSSDGIVGELVQTPKSLRRASGRVAPVDSPTPQVVNPLDVSIADAWDSTSADFKRITERGLIGDVSPAQAKRIGSLAARVMSGSEWTVADCVIILRTSTRMGENDKTEVEYATIGEWLGITANRAEKLARLGRAFPYAKRFPTLGLTLHEEVAALTDECRDSLLTKAASGSMTASQMRELVSAASKDPQNRRNSTGRAPRTPNPANTPPAVVPVVAPSLIDSVDSVNGTGEPRTDEYAPTGKPPAPSLKAPQGLKLLLDAELSDGLLTLCARNVAAAEELLAELVRAHLATK